MSNVCVCKCYTHRAKGSYFLSKRNLLFECFFNVFNDILSIFLKSNIRTIFFKGEHAYDGSKRVLCAGLVPFNLSNVLRKRILSESGEHWTFPYDMKFLLRTQVRWRITYFDQMVIVEMMSQIHLFSNRSKIDRV